MIANLTFFFKFESPKTETTAAASVDETIAPKSKASLGVKSVRIKAKKAAKRVVKNTPSVASIPLGYRADSASLFLVSKALEKRINSK